MDIVEVAKRSGLPASTLRYYEEKRLIVSIGRQGLRRLFQPIVLQQLALIALGRAAGFSLDEISMMFGGNEKPSINRSMLASKADEIDIKIKELKAISNGLKHAAVCPAENHLDCPTFQRLLREATEIAPGSSKKNKGVVHKPN